MSINSIYEKALKIAPHLETWKGYYLVRKVETEILAEKFNFSENSVGLELGCGNAFQSVLLASYSKKIIATDLFNEDKKTHTLGISKANDLINILDAKNVKIISCSASILPFKDNYFDFVFSSSVLEHCEDRESALLEMRRVLKPDGRLIVIVPTHMPSVYAFINVYLYIISVIFKRFMQNKGHPSNSGSNSLKDGNTDSVFNRFRKNHPSFPLPEPHGTYKNVLEELIYQLPHNWIKLLEKNSFTIKDSFGMCLFPWLLIEPFSTGVAAKIYSLTKNINIKLSSIRALMYMSYLMCIILKKNHS